MADKFAFNKSPVRLIRSAICCCDIQEGPHIGKYLLAPRLRFDVDMKAKNDQKDGEVVDIDQIWRKPSNALGFQQCP